MSQLTALFLIDDRRRIDPAAGPNATLGAVYPRFLCARGALTSIDHNVSRSCANSGLWRPGRTKKLVARKEAIRATG
jgi:hypothetical protein